MIRIYYCIVPGAMEQSNHCLCALTQITAVNANHGSNLRAAAIKTKHGVFPWELKIRQKIQGGQKSKLLKMIYYQNFSGQH